MFVYLQHQTVAIMEKAIILSRVSTSHQEIDSQTQVIKNEAIKCGFKEKDLIIIEDIESAIKLSEEERNGLNKMKEYIEADSSITHVFIYELSRLSRRQLVLFSIRDYLINKGIQLVCCTPYFRMVEDGKLSQTANLMFSIFASMAESEMQLKQERMLRGRNRNKLTGKNNCGRPLFGYTVLDDKTIAVDEENARFVVDMFEMYAKGNMSQYEVAKELNFRYGKGGDTKEKMKHKINNLLHRREYCGTTKYPRLISDELFDKAQLALKANLVTIKEPHRDEALLKRILFDKVTGRHMTYSSNQQKQRYTMKFGNKPNVDKAVLDKYVLQLAVILHKAYVTDSEAVKNDIMKKMAVILEKQANLNTKERELQNKIDKVEERLIYGSLSQEKAEHILDDLNKEISECRNENMKLGEECRHLKELFDADTPKELPDYSSFSFDENRELIVSMIERIEISKPSMMKVIAEVYTKVDSFLYTLEIETRKKECTMSSRML